MVRGFEMVQIAGTVPLATDRSPPTKARASKDPLVLQATIARQRFSLRTFPTPICQSSLSAITSNSLGR
ncbi:hypothetical protein I307_00246 [Cryptococcus deuterogattii 99/473]|uniref:Uncharacterized protein n=1 Tax=Cryptococcus deuterogattii Ram5 TaxID=1296110 RepID=A0A0D0U6B1_9TREE|nr:hypothetical protein I309_01037 [Cryptococcus deuterogattii LA55]KIR37244.1 hypothetical protein I352_00558 [Cryptococcus deuterogattii MMRL2647]KIR43713.1 hypothetical protein I313_00557 [Cryptococcus deuterogattii Ram5]KIR92714.1 hypothetical protein I304_03293 [Cryptococcus deuterogattii CBS 10090]KIR98036.1 hypothetical protein L804_04496 [Cryptococcus deuterogattii 2001/935-1]KIY60445.1 hypothetical protein I307_00246 [Cryptococcus deuterogattii 99/473]